MSVPPGYWLSHDASEPGGHQSPEEPAARGDAQRHTPLSFWFNNDPRCSLPPEQIGGDPPAANVVISTSMVPMEPQGLTVYVSGVFDLFHPGHVAFLHKARAAGGDGSTLLVGVLADEEAIMTHAERVAMLRSCRPVTHVIDRPPPALTAEFLASYAIDIVVCTDADPIGPYAVPHARGMMRYIQRTVGASTADIIGRVESRLVASAERYGAASRYTT
jgi:cytidyltransferase-like protein